MVKWFGFLRRKISLSLKNEYLSNLRGAVFLLPKDGFCWEPKLCYITATLEMLQSKKF